MPSLKKKKLLQIVETLQNANERLKQQRTSNPEGLISALAQCQDLAIQIGTDIDKREDGLGKEIVHTLEQYCEALYQLTQSFTDKVRYKRGTEEVRRLLKKAENQIKEILPDDKKEIVFFPYKASMWDSLESIYFAAKEDETCHAIVVPIPYYDKNPDGSFGKMHYEGNEFPEDIPIVFWQDYHLEEEHPEVVYIHNPYDDYNYVTSVHPNYYSRNIKPYTDCLIYVPYYATAGGMSEGQALCPAYLSADYIVIQSPKFRSYFSPDIPDEKFLPFGSPKFDRVIKKCQNPPEVPDAWKSKMKDKTVYFYNTSIGGMLDNTGDFLQKMAYVFDTFQKHKNACLLWRPHPLLESTFTSMRAEFKPIYDALKKRFIEEDLGIYDDTPDITNTIALCDAYIGDSGTSVTSLFGIVGKPLFILNNRIYSEPKENDWRGEIIKNFNALNVDDRWMITQGDKLYYSEPGKYDYHYCCDLSECASGGYYHIVRDFGEKAYACPLLAQDILVIQGKRVIGKIELERQIERGWAFVNAFQYKQYLILIPMNYGAIVKYNTETGEVRYYREHIDVFVRTTQEGIKIGGACIYQDYLLISSPVDDYVFAMHLESENIQILRCGGNQKCGNVELIVDKEDVWMLPLEGSIIKRWNPQSGALVEYEVFPEELQCIHPIRGYVCKQYAFHYPAITEDYIYLFPNWGNLFVRIHKLSGKIEKWKPDFIQKNMSEYFTSGTQGYYIRWMDKEKYLYQMFSWRDRCLYQVNLESGECEEIPIRFDKEELKLHEAGFAKWNDWLQYCVMENAFQSLAGFLEGNLVGHSFDREEQIESYKTIAANNDGSCGEKVHQFVMEKV